MAAGITEDPKAGGAGPGTHAGRVRSEELHRMMVGFRKRLRPDQIPGLVSDHRRRSRTTVSQEDMAYLTGVSALWYGSLERGQLDRNYSEDFLDRVAYGLNLNSSERRALYRLTLGRDPAPRGNPAPAQISNAEQTFLDAQPWPAWYSDPGWELLALNPAALTWFPHMAWETNVMRWTFVYPQSQNQLCDWETVWAPAMLFQMRAHLARWPEHEGLRRTIAQCLEASDFARTLWETEPQVVDNPDGHRRRLYIPGSKEPTNVEIVAQTPMRNSTVRMIALIPVGGYIPGRNETPPEGNRSD